VGEAYSMHNAEKKYTKLLVKNLEIKEHFEDATVISNLVSEQRCERIWTGLIKLRTCSSGYEKCNEIRDP